MLAVVYVLSGAVELFGAVGNLCRRFAYLLVAQFNLERLELNLLAQHIVFAVVAHLVDLSLVAFEAGFGGGYLALLLNDGGLQLVDVGLYLVQSCGQTCYLVFQVLYFERQFAAQCSLLVDGREGGLQAIQVLELLLYGEFFWIFLCHIG